MECGLDSWRGASLPPIGAAEVNLSKALKP